MAMSTRNDLFGGDKYIELSFQVVMAKLVLAHWESFLSSIIAHMVLTYFAGIMQLKSCIQ